MPIPKPQSKEKKSDFVSRCISELSKDSKYKENDQRAAICYQQWSDASKEVGGSIQFGEEEILLNRIELDEEEINPDNLYIPDEEEYCKAEEIEIDESEIVEYDVEAEKPGLWENIRKKKKREGKKYKPAKPGEKDRPSKEAWEKAQAEKEKSKVKLNKPFRTPKGPKKFSVYVKNDKGNIVKVNFGDPNMEIKRDDPKRRKSYRARHNCDNPGPKWKANYWSCKMWSKQPVNKIT